MNLQAYWQRHRTQLQVVFFLIFGLLALLVQLVSRLVCDLAFRGLARTVSIWPFPAQALGSLLAFLVSNVLAKVVSYVTNRKKTFRADNSLCFSVVLYAVAVILLIVIETVIGTPLQNGIYLLLGGSFRGGVRATAAALSPAAYEICGTIAQLAYGIGDAVILFFLDKYVIMTRKRETESAQ